MLVTKVPILLSILLWSSKTNAYQQNTYCAIEGLIYEDDFFVYNCVDHQTVAVACKTPVEKRVLYIDYEVQEGDYEIRCNRVNDEVVLRRSACYTSDGRRLEPNQDQYGIFGRFYATCRYDNGNHAQVIYKACLDDTNHIYQDGEEFTRKGVKIICKALENERLHLP